MVKLLHSKQHQVFDGHCKTVACSHPRGRDFEGQESGRFFFSLPPFFQNFALLPVNQKKKLV